MTSSISSQSPGFFTSGMDVHRTGAITDNQELHAAYERIVRRALVKYGAEDLVPMLLGDGE